MAVQQHHKYIFSLFIVQNDSVQTGLMPKIQRKFKTKEHQER